MAFDHVDRNLLSLLQSNFPLVSRPFHTLAQHLSLPVPEVIARVNRLKVEQRVIRSINAIFDSHRLEYRSTLVAVKCPPECVDKVAAIISQHPGVTHNYRREHLLNLWYTLTLHSSISLEAEVEALMDRCEVSWRLLPAVRVFKIGVNLNLNTTEEQTLTTQLQPQPETSGSPLTSQDICVIRELQRDLEIVERPFLKGALSLGMSEEELVQHANRLKAAGYMRRFAAILHHRRAGFRANGMCVWQVPDSHVEHVGPQMAAFRAVSHCYQRPRYADWPYNLFTMLHARSRSECRKIAAAISQATGVTEYDLLFSTKEYKKTRAQYFTEDFWQH